MGKPWYSGTIAEYDQSSGEHLVVYDDGEQKAHKLSHEEAAKQLKYLKRAGQPLVPPKSAAAKAKLAASKPAAKPASKNLAKTIEKAKAKKQPGRDPRFELLGSRVSIRWLGDRGKPWYSGKIAEYYQSSGEHLVLYDDGEQKAHNLAGEEACGQLRWLG